MRARVPVAAGFLPAPTFSAPITIDDAAITANGSNVFEGNWKQASFGDNHTGNGYGAAIIIATSNPVVIQNSRIQAQCYGIHWSAVNTQVTVRNCLIVCRNTTSAGKSTQRAINLSQPRSAVIENCTLVGGGIQLGVTGSPSSYVRVRYNRMLDVLGMKVDASGNEVFERSNSTTYFEAKQFIQFRDNIVVADGEVAWNEIINAPFVSRREDAINCYGASGVVGKPLAIHDNVIRGGYPTRPYDISFSGAALLVEDGSATAAYIDLDDNQIIGAGNCGANIYNQGTSNIRIRRNRFVSCGRINGGNSFLQNSVMNITGSGTKPTYVTLVDNGYSWRDPKTSTQKGIWFDAIGNAGCSETGSYVIASPTTEATEAAEWALWRAKVAAAGVRIGSTLAV